MSAYPLTLGDLPVTLGDIHDDEQRTELPIEKLANDFSIPWGCASAGTFIVELAPQKRLMTYKDYTYKPIKDKYGYDDEECITKYQNAVVWWPWTYLLITFSWVQNWNKQVKTIEQMRAQPYVKKFDVDAVFFSPVRVTKLSQKIYHPWLPNIGEFSPCFGQFKFAKASSSYTKTLNDYLSQFFSNIYNSEMGTYAGGWGCEYPRALSRWAKTSKKTILDPKQKIWRNAEIIRSLKDASFFDLTEAKSYLKDDEIEPSSRTNKANNRKVSASRAV